MKKITIGLVAFAATAYSSAVLADTPTVRDMNAFDHIQAVSSKNRALTNNASEFVIYHQDGRPCPPKHDKKGEKGKHEKHKHEHKHEHHDEGKHHHHHHHHDKKDEKKSDKSDGAMKAAPKAAAPASGDNGGNQ